MLNMATYLLNWNPRRWDWFELEEEIFELRKKGWLEARWSCGVTKRILPGDRFFLIRLGMPPKGIMASGTIKSSPFVEPHWDDQLAERGKQALFVDVVFDSLLNPDIEQILGLRA
jgi:5-methylcytosine-specific restriction protein A